MGGAASALDSMQSSLGLKPAELEAVADEGEDRVDAKHYMPAQNITITKGTFGLSVRFVLDEHERVTIGKFRRHDGEAGAAETSGKIGLGWAVTMVDGCPVPRPATHAMCSEVADLVRAAPDEVKLRVMKPRPILTPAQVAKAKARASAAAWEEKQRKAAGPLGRLLMRLGDNESGGSKRGKDDVTFFGEVGEGGGAFEPDATPPNKLMAGIHAWMKGDYDVEKKSFLPHAPSGRHVALDKAQRLVTWGALDVLRDQVRC